MNYCKLGDLCQIEKGKIGITKAVDGQYPLVTTAESRGSHNEFHFDKPAVIIPLVSSTGHGHASINRLHYQEGKFAVGSILAVLTPNDSGVLNAQYLYTYLSTNKDQLLVSLMRGAANVSLSISKVKDVLVPVPSIENQLQIVQKFNSLQSDISDFQKQICERYILIKNLRNQVLQDAITGKLSEKWRRKNSNKESVEVLLEKIKAEKKKILKEGKVGKQKPLPQLSDNEIPFKLPEGWVGCRLGEVANINPRNHIADDTKVSFIPMKLIKDGYVSSHTFEERNWKEIKSGFTHFQENDLLVSKITPCFENRKSAIAQGLLNRYGAGTTELHVIRALNDNFVDIKYLLWFVKTEKFIQDGVSAFSGTAGQQRVGSSFIENYIIPLPPIHEQQYIVSRIESLFTKLDSIKELNIENQANTEFLNQVVLNEMFEQ